MKFTYLKICLLVVAPFLLNSCDKNEVAYLAPTAYEQVDEALWPFFQRFEEQAAARGLTVDLRALQITGSIEHIAAEHTVGLCNHNSANGKHLVIDADFFNRSNDYKKEAIIFHELGHCALGRRHDNDTLDSGMCKSLMRSGLSDCLTMYSRDKHISYYLDELFNF